MRTVARPYAAALVRYAESRPDVVALSGDLTASCEVDLFRETFPDRFFNVGMAEQNMLGIAGGMAKAGLLPIVHTFGVFATRRAFDQVAMAIGLPHARVRIMGFLPGLTTPGGPTHQAIDDVALMRAIPGMQVYDLSDAAETASALEAVDGVSGPVYCRVMRGDVPVLFDAPLEPAGWRTLAEGDDLAVVSASVATAEAARAVAALREAGVSTAHVHVCRLQPLDERVCSFLKTRHGVVTLENHLTVGGLGSAIAEVMAAQGIRGPLARLGLQSTYAVGGTQGYLFERFGISATAVLRAAEALTGRPVAASFERDRPSGSGDENRQEAL